jgi:uridine kinase
MLNSQQPYFVFIVGASGSGKTTITKATQSLYSNEETSFNYFDDMGIPSHEEMVVQCGTSEKWQVWATRSWIDKLIQIENKKLIILEGSFYPEFAVSYMQELGIINYWVICIDVPRKERDERLIKFRKQPELAHNDMENYAQALKQQTLNLGYTVLDTSDQQPEESAKQLWQTIQQCVKGDEFK